jgi:hypothetical protein
MATFTEAQLFAARTPDSRRPASRGSSALRPETGGTRVRLAMDPVTATPSVVWCSRYGAHEVRCGQPCLQPDGADEE